MKNPTNAVYYVKWILVESLQGCVLTSWLLAANSTSCSLFSEAPAIFTFQKIYPHSCSQAAVTLGLLFGLPWLLHVSGCERREPCWRFQLRFWKQIRLCLFKIAALPDILLPWHKDHRKVLMWLDWHIWMSMVWCRNEGRGNNGRETKDKAFGGEHRHNIPINWRIWRPCLDCLW